MTHNVKWNALVKRFDDIGVPRCDRDPTSLTERIYPFLDRLYLRPEGEPDTADLVGKINELCDRAGIASGDTADRVEAMQERITSQECRLGELVSVRARLIAERDALRADLDAERAQLASKTEMTENVRLAFAILDDAADGDSGVNLAIAVLREALK